MCKQVNGKDHKLSEILERLHAKKHKRFLAATNVTYSKQEIDSARTVLNRLLVAIPSSGRDSILVHHRKVRV